jgi:DNA-binding MarR family transcriptional regulator
MTRWLSEPEQLAWRGLLQMTTRLEAQLNRELQETSGLSLADYDVLVPLSEVPQGRLRVYELASDLGWERSRLSHHLTRMQRRGLIAREDCDADRRGAFVVLTDAGRSAIDQAAPAHVETVRRLVFQGLSGDQVRSLRAFTESVQRRLDTAEQTGATA